MPDKPGRAMRAGDRKRPCGATPPRKAPVVPEPSLTTGLALISAGDLAVARDSLDQSIPLMTGSAGLETDLALAFDALNKDAEAETHFRAAVAVVPAYARAFSSYGAWLLDR